MAQGFNTINRKYSLKPSYSGPCLFPPCTQSHLYISFNPICTTPAAQPLSPNLIPHQHTTNRQNLCLQRQTLPSLYNLMPLFSYCWCSLSLFCSESQQQLEQLEIIDFRLIHCLMSSDTLARCSPCTTPPPLLLSSVRDGWRDEATSLLNSPSCVSCSKGSLPVVTLL